MDDLEEELAGARVEDEDGAVDGLGGEVALERLVDGDAVHVRVVHEPEERDGRQRIEQHAQGRVGTQPFLHQVYKKQLLITRLVV